MLAEWPVRRGIGLGFLVRIPQTPQKSGVSVHPPAFASGADMDNLNLVPKSPHLRVAIGIAAVAAILALAGKFLGASAKDILTVAAAIGGLSCIAVGLALSQDAFKLLYDRERKSRVRRQAIDANGASVEVEEDTGAAVEKVSQDLAAAAAAAGVTVDLNTLLPRLITTAAGLSVALVLLGTLLLGAATFGTPAPSAAPSPSSSTAPGGSSAPSESTAPSPS